MRTHHAGRRRDRAQPKLAIWWERLGVQPFGPDEPDRLDLHLLTAEIDATLRRLQ
jgi:hypothetical protein